MKKFTLTGTAIAATLLLSACDPWSAKKKPARGPEEITEATKDKPKPTTPKPPKKTPDPAIDSVDTTAAGPDLRTENKPVPPPSVNPEYGKKTDGKPGYIESPYAPGKMIDVRGLPPGTEIEDPYTRRPLLVP